MRSRVRPPIVAPLDTLALRRSVFCIYLTSDVCSSAILALIHVSEGEVMPDQNIELKRKIQDYLNEAKIMQLATSTLNGKPWICSVWFSSDDDFNLYWISATTRRHSKQIAKNAKVAAAISMVREPSEQKRGALQIEGAATQLQNPVEIAKVLKLYASRGIFTVEQVKKFMVDFKHPHRFYKLTPSTIVLFENTKQEYHLRNSQSDD